MKILITGTRDREVTNSMLWSAIERAELFRNDEMAMLIFGDCPTGADRAALGFAKNTWTAFEKFIARWDTLGRVAGPIRNQQMIDSKPDVVIAFWDGKSTGTLDTIRKATVAGIDVMIHSLEERK